MPFTQHSALSTQGFHPEKILVIHSGGIGDLLLALPSMRRFRQAFPRATLEMMGRPERLALVAFDLRASFLHSIDQAGMSYFYLDDAPLPARLGSFFSSFGRVLSFGRLGAETLSQNLKKAGAGGVLTLSSFPPEGGRVHVSDYLVESLRREGIGGKMPDPPLQLPEEASAFARNYLDGFGERGKKQILAIHPGSGSPAKNWPAKNFAAVADWAAERFGILLLTGPAEEGGEEVRRAMKKAGPLMAENLPLISLAGLLNRSRVYLGNDSGITHLAASLGLPTVALFGPTDPAVWGPRGAAVRTLRGRTSCPPCPPKSPRDGLGPCRVNMDPGEVIEVLTSLLR
jgi:ADP-heptose:LPS heptosyltransferase